MLEKIKNKLFKKRVDPAKQFGTEFEVDNWEISRFVVKKILPVSQYHPFPLNELSLLSSAVCYFKPTHIFEWGTHIGKSARVFHETANYFKIETEIHSIDLPDEIGHSEHPGNQRGKLVKGRDNVFLHLGDGLDTSLFIIKCLAPEKHAKVRPLFFIDGDHSYESVKRELSGIIANVPNAIIILHDTFYQSSESKYNIGPYQAVEEILALPDNRYKKVQLNTGLPGMTLLYKVSK